MKLLRQFLKYILTPPAMRELDKKIECLDIHNKEHFIELSQLYKEYANGYMIRYNYGGQNIYDFKMVELYLMLSEEFRQKWLKN